MEIKVYNTAAGVWVRKLRSEEAAVRKLRRNLGEKPERKLRQGGARIVKIIAIES